MSPEANEGSVAGGSLVIHADRLFDGHRDRSELGSSVLVDGERIDAVGHAAEIAAMSPPGARVLSIADTTVVPGFIDVHAHLTFGTGNRSYEEVMEDSDDLMLVRAVRNCQIHLAAGVTTIRDCGSRNRTALSLREASDAGLFPSPRLLVSGAPITPTGGHFWWCNGEADGVDGITTRAKQLLADGVDFLKVMASGGGTIGTDPASASYAAHEIAAVVSAAHDVGRLTTAHCLAAVSIANAVDGGIDQVEHINFLKPDGSRRFDESVAERIVARGINVSPTIQTGYRELEQLKAVPARDLTPELVSQRENLEQKIDSKLEFVGRFHDLGATIVAGTDAIATFGDYAIGLELLASAGLGAIGALRAATSHAAQAIGLGNEVGTIAPGRAADLVVVSGNPVANIRHSSQVRAVIRAGRITHLN